MAEFDAEQLRRIVERRRALFDHAPIGIFENDAQGNCVDVNPYLCELTGLSADQMAGTGWLRAIHPDDRLAVFASWDRVARRELDHNTFEFRMLRADGTFVWVSGNATAVVDGDVVTGFVGTVEDITERRAARDAVEAAEETLRRAFDAAPLGMAITRVDGTFVRVNQRLCELLGASHDEVMARSYTSFSDPAELESETPLLRRMLAGEIDTYEVPKRYVRPDGEVRNGAMRVTSIRRPDGSVEHLLGVVEDVTVRVVAEHERRRAEDQLKSVLELSPIGIILAEGAQALLANPAEREITGRDVTSIDDLREVLHPEDVDEFEARIVEAMAAGNDFTGQTRIVRSDGDVRWVRVTTSFATDGSERTVVITQDITEQVAHEVELARFGELFAALTDFVAMTDEEGRVLYLNRVAEIYGARDGGRVDEIWDFFDEPSRDALVLQAWADVLDQGFWSGELTIALAPGLTIPVSVALVRCVDAHGGNFVAAVARDITALKEAQRKLEAQATHDQLTGLPNRRLLADRMENAIARAERSGHDIALLFIDLDGFKDVNDTHGHDVGDDVLVAVGQRLRTLVREGDTVARLGGDEFVVLLDPAGAPDDAQRVAERIVAALAAPFTFPDGIAQLGASVGLAVGRATDGARADELMKAADIAVYEAKRAGKGRVVAYRRGGDASSPGPLAA